ncbi:MAG: hypothetical protein NTY76_01455 [Candidatus Omnitrophica bacterium]|nr:hypothetical protein [Candidatus Omnitrophota bacterium]
MIEINLLPQELRKKPPIFSGLDFKGIDIKSIPILKIAAGIGAGLVLMQLAVFLFGIISSIELASTTKKYNAILPEKREADILKAKVADINKRSGAIDELMVKRFSWARKINLLSDCMTPGIWLSELYYDERPVPGQAKTAMPGALVMSGYASGVGEQGAALIGKFIKSLQDNKDFYSDVASVELVSTKSDKVDKQDVMSFRINCLFK